MNGQLNVTQIIPDLRVDDIDAARRFYVGFLGMTEEPMGLDWVTRFVAPSGAMLQVLTRDAHAAEDPVLSVRVDDVEAACSAAQEAGWEIVHPLTTEEWGVRRFFVRAPGGAVLNILQSH